MRLYEAFRQAQAAIRLDSRSGDKRWRKSAIAEHAARLMGVTDPVQLAIAWTQDARRPEDLFRLVMKGGK